MLVRFKHDYEGYAGGSLQDIEITLARRFVGLGLAEHVEPGELKKIKAETLESKVKAETAVKEAPPAKKTIQAVKTAVK